MRNLAGNGMTMWVVTHEMRFAREAADEVLFMNGGIAVERGDAREVLASPRERRTLAFLERVLQQGTDLRQRGRPAFAPVKAVAFGELVSLGRGDADAVTVVHVQAVGGDRANVYECSSPGPGAAR